MNQTRNGQSRKGSLTLELVMVVPVLALILMGIIQYSSHLFALQAVQSAAMVAARALENSGATIESVTNAAENALNLPYKNGWISNSVIIAKLNGSNYQIVTDDADLTSGQFMVYVQIDREYAVIRGLNKYQMDDHGTTLEDYPNPTAAGVISAAYSVIK